MKAEAQAAEVGHVPPQHRSAARAARWRMPLSGAVIAGLAAATALGMGPAVRGGDLHAAVGIVAGILAAVGHIRWGAGRDLLATLLLAVGVLLGMGVTGGLVSRGAHGAAALAGALMSMGVHGEHLWQGFRS